MHKVLSISPETLGNLEPPFNSWVVVGAGTERLFCLSTSGSGVERSGVEKVQLDKLIVQLLQNEHSRKRRRFNRSLALP